MSEPLYDRIGTGYPATRRADPRIATAIEEALGSARTVVNVGAGTGNYEPPGREVTAVEPSQEMIDQRPPGSAPVVRSAAETLPFADDSFDAAMALMTIHHWRNVERGLAELRRVARERVVILTWDPQMAAASWLQAEYFPEIPRLGSMRVPSPAEVAEALDGAEVRVVPIPRDCQDGFLEAYWARPEAILDPRVRAGTSAFPQLDHETTARGLERLRRDLESGEWHRRHADLLELDELDLGYRLVVGRS